MIPIRAQPAVVKHDRVFDDRSELKFDSQLPARSESRKHDEGIFTVEAPRICIAELILHTWMTFALVTAFEKILAAFGSATAS